jgi:UDP-4-amino-4,6-dideoxy-N-acetyl-beta-L-altrosamine N-acetyltransferase
MYTRHEISFEEHIAWWARTKHRDDQKYFMCEINGLPVGIVAFVGVDLVNQGSSWAFYASPQAPKGTGSKMEFLALEYAFTVLGLHKLHCEVLAFNTTVIKLHQKFGFVVEGILREQHLVDKSFVDIYRLGLLDCEWAVQREKMKEKIGRFDRG